MRMYTSTVSHDTLIGELVAAPVGACFETLPYQSSLDVQNNPQAKKTALSLNYKRSQRTN